MSATMRCRRCQTLLTDEDEYCPGGCDCSCCYGYPNRDCHCFADPCNCGGDRAQHGQKPIAGKTPGKCGVTAGDTTEGKR